MVMKISPAVFWILGASPGMRRGAGKEALSAVKKAPEIKQGLSGYSGPWEAP